MIKKILFALVVSLVLPVSSSLASVKVHSHKIVKAPLVTRLESFILRHGHEKNVAHRIAEILASCDHPRVLAAIAAKESNFNTLARGTHGEIGAFQQRPDIHGHPGWSWKSQARSASRILDELLEATGGKLETAVRRYNGTGNAATHYSRQVLAMANSI